MSNIICKKGYGMVKARAILLIKNACTSLRQNLNTNRKKPVAISGIFVFCSANSLK
jgi:hypothetical protein